MSVIRGTTVTTPLARHAVTDDTVVSKKPWSSKNTVDKLCPSFTESGAVVVCEPLEGAPLTVVSNISPLVVGTTGDPNNPCQIEGHDKVTLSLSGKNLFSGGREITFTKSKDIDLSEPIPPGTYTISLGSYTGSGDNKPVIIPMYKNASGNYTATSKYLQLFYHTSGSVAFTCTEPITRVQVWSNGYSSTDSTGISCTLYEIQIEQGETRTAYEEYVGSKEFSISFGDTVYGGSFSWSTGELIIDYVKVTLDGTETVSAYDSYGYQRFMVKAKNDYPTAYSYAWPGYCTHFKAQGNPVSGNNVDLCLCTYSGAIYCRYDAMADATAFKTFLQEQYAAGTPVELVYYLKTPTVVQLTPQEINTLKGTNIISSTTGETKVNGYSDPKILIEKLMFAILALGGNV